MTIPYIRVLLIDENEHSLAALSEIVAQTSDMMVAGKTGQLQEVKGLIAKFHPSVICVDYLLAKMNSFNIIKEIMSYRPLPILVLNRYFNEKDSKEIFSILEAGAADYILKPNTASPLEAKRNFLEKIRILSKVYIIGKQASGQLVQKQAPSTVRGEVGKALGEVAKQYAIVVVGASTGGPKALLSVLGSLPKEFPVPILCIQHISKGFLGGFASWLREHCHMNVQIAKHEEMLANGTIYLPVEGAHLVIDQRKRTIISFTAPEEEQRPSINVTMRSVAHVFGRESVAILLTGMGCDGAAGMAAIKQAGGLTIAQNKESSAVFGMPSEAIARHAVDKVLPPREIGLYLMKIFGLPLRT